MSRFPSYYALESRSKDPDFQKLCSSPTLTLAFNDKCRDYLEPFEREGLSFIPLAVQSIGGWHQESFSPRVCEMKSSNLTRNFASFPAVKNIKLTRLATRSTSLQGGEGCYQAPVPEIMLVKGQCCPHPQQDPLLNIGVDLQFCSYQILLFQSYS